MKSALKIIAATLMLMVGTRSALALRVQDITRLKGDQPNELIGMGLVFGLNGTGDGGDSSAAMRPLQTMLAKFGDPITATRELKDVKNVALVHLSVTVPAAGVHMGDRLDVKVSGIASKSLKGGQLLVVPMLGPHPSDRNVYAWASGALQVETENLNVGTVKGGCVMQTDIRMEPIVNGTVTLVLLPSSASYAMATAIAEQINEDVSPETDGKPVAIAEDATSIVVTIPKPELGHSAAFIARIKALPVPSLPGAAKVRINSSTGTIVFSGDVELSPAMISHKTLTITITAPNAPAAAPAGAPGNTVTLDAGKQGGAKLKELVDAFNMMKVPAADRIEIVKQLVDIGALHCELTEE
jgi:flagellar P-ring protein FlgI